MAELTRRSALPLVPRRRKFGREEEAGCVLSERRGLALALVAAFPAGRQAVRQALAEAIGGTLDDRAGRASPGPRATALAAGPERWLVVWPEEYGPALGALAPEHASVVDWSHARTVIRVAGGAARRALAKGTLLDLDPAAFPPGAVAQTALFHAGVLLHAHGAAIDLYVPRSFAESFWDSLVEAAGEFGGDILP